jgi:signal transduction histidine kinase
MMMVPSTWRSYLLGLGPAVLVWALLVGWLAWLIADRAGRSEEADRAALREWLDETRNFRKTLPELLREWSRLPADDPDGVSLKVEEIEEHLRALNEPLRSYPNQLPLFPEVYRIEIRLGDTPGPVYESGLPRPRTQTKTLIRDLTYDPLGDAQRGCTLTVKYRLHAANKLLQQEGERQRQALLAEVLLVAATVLAALYVFRFLRAERLRELQRLTILAETEHRERELAEAAARAAAAETTAAEMRTQLFANIGIMAGSYAHNIKNLIVRPNDLLARCLDAGDLPERPTEMLREVRGTLGTVSDRLQQILAAVRRDPDKRIDESLDLNDLLRETERTWATIALSQWKATLTVSPADRPVPVVGDRSNLVQVIENLLFNARDATFEMRNHLRDDARNADPAVRRDRLIAAAAWVGSIAIAARPTDAGVELTVTDTGIGMTADVKAKCLETHFSTKRDNALYEGHAAGMGLGLSFVATVLSHHGATMTIESEPRLGTTFRIVFSRR